MSCDPDLDTLISEIEWLVKNHSRCAPEFHDRLKPCGDECHTMKITMDIFFKLHQMLHNYIGLLNFQGPKSRDLCCLKIPLNEALDVAVRAMISTMQSSARKQPSSTPVCNNCNRNSELSRYRSTNDLINKCDFDKLPEIEEVDKKLLRLKVMTVENVEHVEGYIKDILHAITKLPLTSMTSRLEILSSVVRNMKNKLTSCGRPRAGLYCQYCTKLIAEERHWINSGLTHVVIVDSLNLTASLMRTQVNPISKIIGDFILEYGQMKSKIYPCRKICRFCNSVICPLDRQRHIYCCENAKHLNFLWKEWIQQNSLKGVAKWDEDTIMSIVDSFKDTPVEGKRCVTGGPCATFCRTAARQRDSRSAGQDAEGESEEKRRGDTKGSGKQENIISSDFSQGGSQGVDNRPEDRGLQDREARGKIGRLETGEKRNSEDPGKKGRFRASQKQDRGKGRGTNSHSFNIRSAGEGDIRKNSDMDKTSRKKGFKKDADGVDLDDQGDSLRVDSRKKGTRSGRGDTRKMEDDSHPGNKGRGKSSRKKEGEVFDHSAGDQRIGNRTEPSGVESSKKGRGAKNPKKDTKDGQGTDEVNSPGKEIINPFNKLGNRNGTIEPGGSEIELLGNNDVRGISPGTKTRENYGEVDGKRSSVEGLREVKSGNGTREDSQNIIQYRLSNELFIELGWTLLPKDTIMRRVVQFQALLAKPHMNWFTNSRIYGKQYYPDEKTIFMNFLEDGSGHVYYPNGRTAIAAQISKRGTDHELYKVYALGGRDVMGVVRLPWLIGVFDSMGNGVVYDEDCNVRLTYNQNGGVYVDNPAKVPFSWGWNNFQTFPIDEAVYAEPLADQLMPELMPSREVKRSSSKASKQSKSSKVTSSGKLNEDQSAFGDQKSIPVESVMVIPRKVITPLKPICLRMNKYLSLRIMDRKNINLQFFAGPRCVRIELGTEIDPNVQINSELVDRDEWTAKMTKSRFHVDMNEIELNTLSPDNSMLEIAKEFQHAKNEANSRQLMIAKYRPHLISSSYQTSNNFFMNLSL